MATSWTLIEAAAAGAGAWREAFACRYSPVIIAYLSARWRGSPHANDVEDASQEVFLECFRLGGPLERANRNCASGFRAFLFGVVRNIALRYESRRARERSRRAQSALDFDALKSDDTELSRVFDRAWAEGVMRAAAERQRVTAEAKGAEAKRRVELLQLRFQEGLAIREIAARWNEDPVKVHRDYARARREFKAALRQVVAFDHPNASPDLIEQECADLLRSLG